MQARAGRGGNLERVISDDLKSLAGDVSLDVSRAEAVRMHTDSCVELVQSVNGIIQKSVDDKQHWHGVYQAIEDDGWNTMANVLNGERKRSDERDMVEKKEKRDNRLGLSPYNH